MATNTALYAAHLSYPLFLFHVTAPTARDRSDAYCIDIPCFTLAICPHDDGYGTPSRRLRLSIFGPCVAHFLLPSRLLCEYANIMSYETGQRSNLHTLDALRVCC